MIRNRRSLVFAASLVMICAGADFARSQELFTTGAETWSVDASGVLTTRDWPAASILKLTLTTIREQGSQQPKAPSPNSPPAPPELVFRSDHSSNMMGILEVAGGQKTSVFLRRSIVFDPERRALRVLDLITSGEERDRNITLTYTTRWHPEFAKRIPTPRQFLVPGTSVSSSVAAGVMDDPKLPLLMFLYGIPDKAWKREVSADPESLRWSYTGMLPAKQRIVMLHWLALTDDVKTETVRKVRQSLVSADGMPKEAFVDEQTLKELANFPMLMEGMRTGDSQDNAELPLVTALAESHSITPTSGHDHLVLTGMPMLQGDFEAAGIKLIGQEEETIALEKIAAIQGGAGIGRSMRVYFRDGSITSGRLTWTDGKFVSKTLGTIKIDPEKIDAIVLRTNDSLDGRQRFAALWATPDHDVRLLEELPSDVVQIRWPAGLLAIAWKDITSLRQLPAPDLGQEVTLRDGSLVRGWITSTLPEHGPCLAYATSWPGLVAALNQKEAAPPVTALHLRTTDESRLTGDWADQELSLATSTGEVRMPTSDIRRVEVTAGGSGEPVLLEVTTLAGATVRGTAASEVCAWSYQGQSVAVPWPIISEIARPEPSTAKP